MGKIHKLSSEVVSQIAAGEVIERPAYVVKELIENALDAEATDIDINLVDYGLSKIEVTDNGLGMSKEDLELAVLPHTTSKLQAIDDLHHIITLGFRGEALVSIDSVSDLTISSKTSEDKSGYEINKKKLSPVGMQTGTKVTVSNLFKNVPARKKFLKSNTTELRAITEIVTQYVFSHPEVSFKLTNNNRVLIDEIKSTTKKRIQNLWGEDIEDQMLPLKDKLNSISLKGFLGKPQLSLETQNKLWVYVNNRRVNNPIISTAIREAFGTLLMTKSYPVGVIFIQTPPELVDVNIHPTKREIRFVHSNEVFNEVKEAVSNLLLKHNLTFQNIGFADSTIKENLRKEVATSDVSKIGIVKNEEVLQIHQSFLVSETQKGFQLIDQHAAHESLLYFEFLNAWENKKKLKKKITLDTPVILELSINDSLIIEEHIEQLIQLGFDIELFGSRSYRITAVPELYENQDIKVVINDLLETFSENPTKLTEKEHHFLATLACKSAIKAGVFLNDDQRKKIIDALDEKNYAYTCPHGRPVRIEVSLNQLGRMFKRK